MTTPASLVDTIVNSVRLLDNSHKLALLEKLDAAGLGQITPSAKSARYAHFAAVAQKSEMAPAVKMAAGQLRRVGLSLEEVLDGGVAVVDKATKERNISLEDRMSLKASLGLIKAL